ncbi:ASPIC/UnbV domain-containing protein [Bacteroidota bacterium]
MTRELTQENGLHACNGLRMHFGLGDANIADSLVIRWPMGHVDTYLDVPASHFYKAIEKTELELVQ